MTNTVFCRKYKQEMPAMPRPPYPGPKGQTLYETVSHQAWQEWLSYQTMLINEKQLNMMDASSREYLQSQLEKFLDSNDLDQIAGYRPPNRNSI